MADGATSRARPANRRAIGVTCAVHEGPRGFANLVVEKQGDEIILDPYEVTGECVIIFDEAAARVLSDALEEWPG
ncbi:MAG: hypothetical protein ACRDRI_05320 [Pseudonocardiaceae bacterium]